MAVLLGLLAAAFYGAADFFGGLATKRGSILPVTILSQGAGFVFLLLVLPFFHGRWSSQALTYGAAAGICGGIGIALLYHALSIGKMGVVSPITAVVAAAFPVGAGVLRGEHLTIWQTLGISIALVAVVLISLTFEAEPSVKSGRVLEISTAGVREAIVCGVFIGGFFIFLARAGSGAGMYSLLTARFVSTTFLLLLALVLGKKIVPARQAVPIVLLIGGMDMTANCLYVLATYAGYLSIAAVLTSLYPASTVLLARIVLGERLAALQKVGVVLALAGVALIAL